MIVITSGKKYLDIDSYATCIAYRELLSLLGIDAKFISNAILNYSITPNLLKLPFSVDKYQVGENDKFIIVDLSNKDFFDDFVNEEQIIEIIDHHPGFEEYWKNLLGEKSIIEPIGSVATIIVEKYEKNNLLDKMDTDVAKLLMAAILDNTLNFTANITKQRDKDAYNKLEKMTGDVDFKASYFEECQKIVEDNLKSSIINDLKIEPLSSYLPEIMGQLTIWNINTILNKKGNIEKIMNEQGSEWLINIISLEDNKSYIMCSNQNIKNNLAKLFDGNSYENILMITPAKLRKEIIKIALDFKEGE